MGEFWEAAKIGIARATPGTDEAKADEVVEFIKNGGWMKIVYVVTPDPCRLEVGTDAYECLDEARARKLQRRTGKTHYVVPARLDNRLQGK